MAKYQRVLSTLKDAIVRGKYELGERICTEAELVQEYGVSSTTAVRALKELEREGLVTRRRGKGTFLRSRHIAGGGATAVRTLLLHGRSTFGQSMHNQSITWFIGYEIHRGVINSYPGPVRLVQDDDLADVADMFAPDEVCAVAVDPSDAVVASLQERGTPSVFIDREELFAKAQPNSVAYDRASGVYEAMTYLVHDLGHRDIAMVTSETRPHPARLAGYVAGLENGGVPYRPELVIRAAGLGTPESGYDATRALLDSGQRFTAVFADTDMKAVGVISALREAGLRVPEDVSVLGFDDIPGAADQMPPLTTVHMPNHEIGIEAVRLLKERLRRDGADVPGVILDTHLVVRGSCGPAAPQSEGGQ
jgi:hypothetical protein